MIVVVSRYTSKRHLFLYIFLYILSSLGHLFWPYSTPVAPQRCNPPVAENEKLKILELNASTAQQQPKCQSIIIIFY